MGTAYNLAVSTTSSSSVLIGTGDKTFTVGAGLGFIPGMSISVARTSAPGTSSMFGVVKTYSSTTLVVTVASVTGSGTFTDWSISLAAAAVGAGLGSNTFSGVQNFAQGSNIASAATINLTTATGNFVNITGTTGISTVILGNGMWRLVKFAGACLLTYSATTNKLNTGGANYTTSAGDTVLYIAGDGVVNGVIFTESGLPPVSFLPNGLTSDTAQATTSGTSKDFNPPSWAKRITIMLSGVSTNGTSFPIIQIGGTGTPETTGYLGAASGIAGTVATVNHNTGFSLTNNNAAASIRHGSYILSLLDVSTNTWVISGSTGNSDSATNALVSGSKALGDVLDIVRLTTVNGTDAFDAGKINILYE